MVTKVLKQVPSGQKPDRMVLKAKAPARRRLENLNVFVCNFYISQRLNYKTHSTVNKYKSSIDLPFF